MIVTLNSDDTEDDPGTLATITDGTFYLISNSEAQTWKRCRRKWWLSWYNQLERKAVDFTNVRQSGNRVHRALATWYQPDRPDNFDLMEALRQVIEADRIELVDRVTDLQYPSNDDMEIAVSTALAQFDKAVTVERAMVEGYIQWLEETGADEGFEIISSETPLRAYIGDVEFLTPGMPSQWLTVPVIAIGILDARLRRTRDGASYFIDHKTVASLTDPYPTLKMNEQMLHYMLLDRYAGEVTGERRVAGAYYNMLRRVKRTASAKPPFYDRVEIEHNVIEIESYRHRLLGVTRDILRATDDLMIGADPNQVAYPSPRGECSWDCDFFSVCPLFDDGSHVEDMLAARYRKHDPLDRYQNTR